jgi:hypothetical protein
MTSTTRDLAQEIDDLSTQQAAVITAIRNYAEHPHDSVDILAACILDAFDKATEELNEVQAEIVPKGWVEQAGRSACREAGLTNRVDVGETTTPLDPDDSVALYVRPAERDAFLTYRRAARIQAEAALTTIDYLRGVARDTSDALRALLDAITS